MGVKATSQLITELQPTTSESQLITELQPTTTEPTFTTLSTMNQLEENRARRKRILQEALEESDSDDHDEEEGIYTSTNKKILSEIREGQRLRKKRLMIELD